MTPSEITLDELLIEINKSINNKIIGINFLELLKFELIEKFKDLEKNDLNSLKLMPTDGNILEKEIDLNNRKIQYKVEYFDKSASQIKEKINNNCLWVILDGLKSITVYDFNNDNKSIFSNLSKNMGIVLSLNTVISSRIVKKSIILSISSN